MVMSRHARDLLAERYGAPHEILDVVPHGAPDRPFGRQVEFKARLAGKVVTVLQFVTFVAVLRFPRFVTTCLWVVGIASAYSIVDYTYALWRARAR